MNNNLSPAIARSQAIAERQIDLFEEEFAICYGTPYAEAMLDYACHAAFPLTLTTELAYLLRQFVQKHDDAIDLPWTAAPELLLSNLCDVIGSDLYSIEVPLRTALLERLKEIYGESRIDELADWMKEYIDNRLREYDDPRQQMLELNSEWTALACLKDDAEIAKTIEARLIQLLADSGGSLELFRWSPVVENIADLLAQRGLRRFELDKLLQRLAQNQLLPIELTEFDRIENSIDSAGFPPLQSKTIEYATISFEETAIESGDALYPFEFETAQFDEQGKFLSHEQCRVSVFREPLAPDIGLEMVAIPGGKFIMGSPETEHDRTSHQRPQHEVTVSPFFIGKYSITQAQWRIVANMPVINRELNLDPSRFKGDNLPVENVSWEDAIEFCQRLSRETGREYRLPTEAEWEYACRAWTITPFYFGETITGDLANYGSNGTYASEQKVRWRQTTTPVGYFLPNRFGLCDMHGNVWEWCLDSWHNSYKGAPTDGTAWLLDSDTDRKVIRGGAWSSYPRNCRSATRKSNTSANRINHFGFRVVCEISPYSSVPESR